MSPKTTTRAKAYNQLLQHSEQKQQKQDIINIRHSCIKRISNIFTIKLSTCVSTTLLKRISPTTAVAIGTKSQIDVTALHQQQNIHRESSVCYLRSKPYSGNLVYHSLVAVYVCQKGR